MTETTSHVRPTPMGFLLVLFFASGAAALIYEVLWLKELSRLFGATAYAAATTLAVFFLGLAAGGLTWGRRAGRMRNPLRVYACLELGIAVSALLYFVLFDLYQWISVPVYTAVGYRPVAILVVKFLLAAGILFLPAFFMGGTLPVMAQFLVRRADELGRRASVLYALNTIGAAVGAFLAGFFLPRYFGFRNSYFLAIGLNLVVAAVTYAWSARQAGQALEPRGRPTTEPGGAETHTRPVPSSLIWATAALSGFVTLGLEVLWTRMFAQVLQNSVYTFSVILTVFLAALAVGSAVASLLSRRSWNPRTVLFVLLTLSGLMVGLTPLIFYQSTSGLESVGSGLGFGAYIGSIFGRAVLVLLIPTAVMGSIFPYLMKLSERSMKSAGRTVGQLAAVNTAAAILGSLIAGFILLNWWGLWASIRVLAIAYLALAVVVGTGRVRWPVVVPVLGIGLLAFGLTYSGFSSAWLDREVGEELLDVREGPHGTVAVVRRGEDLRIKVNNSYLVGTSQSAVNLRLQSHLPLCLQREARSVFYLGMGTGITAGGALDFPVERVVVSELNPDIVRASRTHFRPYVNGLFDDPRVTLVIEDGRTLLASSREHYDLVIADIFLCYKAGVGGLYTREHFETVRDRLAPDGAFVQWLTMFDLSEPEFGIIARTMLDVFPQVTLWRRGFSPRYPIYALIGRTDPSPLDRATLGQNLERLALEEVIPSAMWIQNIPLAAYAGNLTLAAELFEPYPLSTDDRTPLEYLAPITERNAKGARVAPTLSWASLAGFCERILRGAPPIGDPYLGGLPRPEIDQVRAGLAFYRYETNRRRGLATEAQAALLEYQRLIGAGSPDMP